jgi:hypothetical protein
MQTVGLTWQQAGELAGVLAVAGVGMAVLARPRDDESTTRQRVRAAGAFVREAAMVAGLFGLWQLANTLARSDGGGAFARARWIRRFDDALPLPSEHTMQHLVLPHPVLVQGANLYYATMHMTTMFAFLVWLFVRHRDRYRPIRTVVAVTTLGCLLVQLVPVAPPRMLPGFVDTALRFGQSVYSNGLPIDQLSAMPSIHVAWAVTVGWYAWRVSPSRWRWLGPLHAVLTCLVVVVTGNHWWLDGIVAVAILVVSAWLVAGLRAAAGRVVRRATVAAGGPAERPAAEALSPVPR